MMKIKKVYKYGTGDTIPEGAIYLCTKTQLKTPDYNGKMHPCWLVWHYFLVEVEETTK